MQGYCRYQRQREAEVAQKCRARVRGACLSVLRYVVLWAHYGPGTCAGTAVDRGTLPVSAATLAAATGLSPARVNTALRELERVQALQCLGKVGGADNRRHYRVVDYDAWVAWGESTNRYRKPEGEERTNQNANRPPLEFLLPQEDTAAAPANAQTGTQTETAESTNPDRKPSEKEVLPGRKESTTPPTRTREEEPTNGHAVVTVEKAATAPLARTDAQLHPQRSDVDEVALQAHYQRLKAQHRRRYHDAEVYRALHVLAHDRDIPEPLTMADLQAIVTDWMARGQPMRAAHLWHEHPRFGVPWWEVCLQYGRDAGGAARRGPPQLPVAYHPVAQRVDAKRAEFDALRAARRARQHA